MIKLRDEKKSIKDILVKIKDDMESAHEEEFDLRKRIIELVEKEGVLNTKKIL